MTDHANHAKAWQDVRFRWLEDDESPEYGDIPPAEMDEEIRQHGHMGCIMERQCSCCGLWVEVASLWGIVGDEDYHREVERNFLRENPEANATSQAPDPAALDAIALILDGTEWGSDIGPRIAEIVRGSGRRVRSPEEMEDEA